MCKDCNNEPYNPETATLEEIIRMLTKGNESKSEEEEIREITEGLDRVKANVVKSVSVDSMVTIHFLPGYSKHGDSVIKLVTELQRNYVAPGKVDVFFPASIGDNKPVMTNAGMAEGQAATVRFLNGKPDSDGKDRTVFIDAGAFGNNKSTYNWHMPVYDNNLVKEGAYVTTHEWGHVLDNRPYNDEFAKQLESKMQNDGLVDFTGRPTNQLVSSLSRYGMESEKETYAECFTEWVVTNGKTDNFATKWYAKEYNWPKLPTGIHYEHRRRTPDNHVNDMYSQYYGSPYYS